MDLNTTWFLLFGVLITGYAILDGFDLGVGFLYLFTPDNHHKRIMLNAIGPIWDGNEVWLLTAGGALFAAFPVVYATTFSSMYHALMLVLFALIFRAVSMEFRGKVESPGWTRLWDLAFGLGSTLPAVLFGVAVGNILSGLPLDRTGIFQGNFFTLLNPYSILIGLLSLSLFAMHGSIYMTLKSDGELQRKMIGYSSIFWVITIVLFVLATVYTFFAAPFLFETILSSFVFWLMFLLLLAGYILTPVTIHAGRYFLAFLGSSLTILSMIGLAAVSLYPRLVPSSLNLDFSLTIYNASSTPKTLLVMLIIALIGMPLVIAYTWIIYRIFKGKVELTDTSY